VPPGRETEIAQILEEHGLKDGHPELMEYAEANKGKPWYLVGQGFVDLTKSIQARQAGTSAGVVPSQGQVANPDLEAAFRKELDSIMNPKDSAGNDIGGGKYGMNTLRTLQAKYAELGLTEDQMDISNTGSIKTRGFLYRSESPYSQG
jgi:hypothetical protein